jgi:signal recognition particle receptor subunit beta
MFITSDERKSEFLGKIAALGQGGSGKTFLINSIANYLAEKELYPWNEEANMAGTIAVTPYSLKFSDRRVVVNDNPGQDSLEFLRNLIASQGEVYQGIVLVVDAVGWNFRKVGSMQAASMVEATKSKSDLPLIVIISKRDLRDYLVQSNKISIIATVMANAIKNISNGYDISFNSRMYKKKLNYTVKLSDPSLIPLTTMEQILTTALDNYLEDEPIKGFTKMNVRLFIRSFLLGYCEAMKSMIDLGKYPVFASIGDPSLVNRLNYHRPTALETGSGWEKLGKSSISGSKPLEEPPILRQTFDSKTIELIINNYVLASESKVEEFVDEMQRLGKGKWNVVSFCYTNALERTGKEQIKNTLIQLINEIAERKANVVKPVKRETISDIGLDEF